MTIMFLFKHNGNNLSRTKCKNGKLETWKPFVGFPDFIISISGSFVLGVVSLPN